MKKGQRLYLETPFKSTLLWDEATDAWTYYSGKPQTKVSAFYNHIPTLFRGVEKIADAVSSMPFDIYRGKGDEPVDSSQYYQNTVDFLPNYKYIFGIVSKSLDLTGTAYLFPNENDAGYRKGLQYWAPSSIEPIFDERTGELIKFERSLPGGKVPYEPEDVIYMWLDDPNVENEPPKAYPAKAAMLASGVLNNLDAFVAMYFNRGAVRPFIVNTQGQPTPEEAARMETWFTRMMGGIKNAFKAKVFNADKVGIQQIGDGLSELRDVELTKIRREDVAMALGVPASILYEQSVNRATAEQHKKDFYDDCVVPRCDFMQGVLNEQLFEPAGYRLKFKPETLDLYQVDENERSESAARITQAVNTDPLAFKLSSIILGMELNKEAQEILDDLIKQKEEAREQMQNNFDSNGGNMGDLDEGLPETQAPIGGRNEDQNEMRSVLMRWQKKALRSMDNKGTPIVNFETDIIPVGVQGAIIGSLETCETKDDVKKIFSDMWVWSGYP